MPGQGTEAAIVIGTPQLSHRIADALGQRSTPHLDCTVGRSTHNHITNHQDRVDGVRMSHEGGHRPELDSSGRAGGSVAAPFLIECRGIVRLVLLVSL